MKSRDSELKSNWGTICTLVQMTSENGKRHKDKHQPIWIWKNITKKS